MSTITLRKIAKYASRGISPRYVDADGLLVLNQKCIRNQRISLEPARLTDKEKKFGSDKKLQKFDIQKIKEFICWKRELNSKRDPTSGTPKL